MKKHTPWWGTGDPPHELWPGVSLTFTPEWSSARNRWETHGGRYYFDMHAADLAEKFFPLFLTHHMGEFAGEPFKLRPDQAKLLTRPIFGWKTREGLRRFRKVFAFCVKGYGKSPWGAGTGIYLARYDQEPAAEVYAVAAETKQARIVFENAKIMVETSPDLLRGCEVLRDSLVWEQTRSGYYVISSDASTKHGFRPHAVIFDEMHAQKNRDLFEALTRSMPKRRQPIMIIITHAGSDEESVCYEEYDLAKRVLTGNVELETVLPVLFEMRDKWTESVQSFAALERLDEICTCRTVPPILMRQVIAEACAGSATTDGVAVPRTRGASASTIQIDQSDAANSARPVTSNPSSTGTLSTRPEPSRSEGNGHLETQRGSGPHGESGALLNQASDTWPPTTDLFNTECPASNTRGSGRSKVAGVGSADKKLPSYTSIIATLRNACEDSSVSTAISESVVSEILQRVYDKHLPTCDVRGAFVSGSSLKINHPADDWQDEAVWRRVNPGHGTTVKHEAIVEECREAIVEPRKRNDFLRYHGNMWTNQATAWIPMDWWDACKTVLSDDLLVTLECGAGLDLAQKWDLACFCVVFRRYLPSAAAPVPVIGEDEAGAIVKKTVDLNYEIYVRPYFWIPEETMVQHEREDGIDYSTYRAAGLVTATEGSTIDYSRIYADITTTILPTYPKLKQGTICYDPAFATDLATKLKDPGGLRTVELQQNYRMLSEPSQIVEALIKGRRLHHDGHRVLRWNWANAAVRTDDAGRIRPVKPRNPAKRIDGVIATIMGDRAVSLNEHVEKSFQMFFLGAPKDVQRV